MTVRAKFLYIPDGHIATSYDEYLEICRLYKDELGQDEVSRLLDESAGSHIREQREVKNEILAALAEDRLEVHYQPIYSIKDRRFVSAEALARIVNSEGKLIMPGLFIPVAEEYGLIDRIGERVFEITCHSFRENALLEKGIEYLEVNLSVAQCENSRLSEIYERSWRRNR
jgi:sensor c-di-GMP phosphodiesterase-like protein